MSAFLCSDSTFDYIATAAGAWLDRDVLSWASGGTLRDVDEGQIATVLYLENVRSLEARYPSHGPAGGLSDGTPYTYVSVPRRRLDPTTVIKSCDCLKYQSCEADDYDRTVAARLLLSIREAAIRQLMPVGAYEAAAWGWERPTMVSPRDTMSGGAR